MKNYFYVSPSGDGWRNLAADEWFLDNLGPDELILYFYVNRNAVIIGRNQNPWKECDLAAMDRDGVQLVRRVTGGGAVFHDGGNLNFSFIAGAERYDQDRQFGLILSAVRSLGIPCEFSGRNDLLADGRKFSGNAFCSRGGNRQHHGTLLVSADMTRLQNYLQVDPRKLQAKGVSSVRSRVCNLSEFRPGLTVPVLLDALRRAYAKDYGGYTDFAPTAEQSAGIEKYYAKHASWEWRIGATPAFDLEIETRFPWGGVQLLLTLEDGRVAKADVFTDAMDVSLSDDVKSLLAGCRFGSRELSGALRRSDKQTIRDLADYVLAQNL
jgi:lipoate-protein ligase A